MAKKKRIPPDVRARRAENMRLLEERIAYNEKKLAEEKRDRGAQPETTAT